MKGVFSAMILWAGASLASGGTLVPIGAERTFVPQGFDDNDQIQVTIEGKLDSDCYRLETPNVQIDNKNHRLIIQPMASYYQWMCLEVQVPWTQVVDVGRLEAGEWVVKVGSHGETGSLRVESSSTISPDDHVYAPVDSLSIDFSDGKAIAKLRGHFSSPCAEIEEIKMIDSGKTIEVLPILKAGTARNCELADTPFERSLELPRKASGRYLVHVRSLNGQALNQVYEIN